MKKLKNFIKSNIKVVIAFMLGISIAGSIGVYAATVIASSSVSYSNTTSGLSSTNVKDALDELADKAKNTNSKNNIVIAYTYDESSCITGDESTCEVTTCYKTKIANSCKIGTIIKYRVNNNEIKVFYVLHDDGITITMQQKENTLKNNMNWNESTNSALGPIDVLNELEIVTSSWTNVNTITYSMGSTNFLNNAYTGCSSYNSCTTNIYTLSSRTVKARMITLQEANYIGCTNNTQSCPIFMNNYTYGCKEYSSCTVQDLNLDDNWGYWTMNANSTTTVWIVNRRGFVDIASIDDPNRSARAVVVINK